MEGSWTEEKDQEKKWHFLHKNQAGFEKQVHEVNRSDKTFG